MFVKLAVNRNWIWRVLKGCYWTHCSFIGVHNKIVADVENCCHRIADFRTTASLLETNSFELVNPKPKNFCVLVQTRTNKSITGTVDPSAGDVIGEKGCSEISALWTLQPNTVWFCFCCLEFRSPGFFSLHIHIHCVLKTSGQQIVKPRKNILTGAYVSMCACLCAISREGVSAWMCVWLSVFETHLVRDGQQHSVQLLHQLFEGRSLGGNSMPALTHHHIAMEKKHNNMHKNYF